jgi:hypothetical protein
MRPIVLTVKQWQKVKDILRHEHPKTVFMLRDKMKRVLGFTVREHQSWIESPKMDSPTHGYSQFEIHLDFYSEKKRSMFLLKFSEILNNDNGTM